MSTRHRSTSRQAAIRTDLYYQEHRDLQVNVVAICIISNGQEEWIISSLSLIGVKSELFVIFIVLEELCRIVGADASTKV